MRLRELGNLGVQFVRHGENEPDGYDIIVLASPGRRACDPLTPKQN
jgi:hypothetical protein